MVVPGFHHVTMTEPFGERESETIITKMKNLFEESETYPSSGMQIATAVSVIHCKGKNDKTL